MTIGERIKRRRRELHLTPDEVAERLGKNRATIYRYESDFIENLPITILEPLSKILKCTPAYLMGWEDKTPNVRKVRIKELIDEFSEDETTANIKKYLALDEISIAAVNSYIDYEYTQTQKRQAAAGEK